MLEDYVSAKITRRRLQGGPAANHVDDFSDWLHARGHDKRSLFRMLQSFAGWTDWLTKTGRTAEDFAEGLQECTKHFRSAPHIPYERGPRRESLRVARLFLRFLRERGLLPQIAGADSLACSSPLLQEFHSWMLEQRGVTRVTLDVYHRVLVAAEKFPDLKGRSVSPHQLRHSCAVIMLQATRDIRKVALWLGHSDMRTTEVYLRVDPSEKLEAMEAVLPPSLRRGRFKAPDALIASLQGSP